MKFALLAAALVLIITLPDVLALDVPTLRFIPERFSADAAFLVVAETPEEVARISWLIGESSFVFGQFPKTDTGFVCYFSGSDPENTCGPSPYIASEFSGVTGRRTFSWQIVAENAQQQVADNIEDPYLVEAGGITVTPEITVDNQTVFIRLFPQGATDSATFSVYTTNLTRKTMPASLSYDFVTGSYNGSITLDEGEYFLAFSVDTVDPAGDFGGGIVRLEIGSEEGPAAVPEGQLVIEPLLDPDGNPLHLNLEANIPFSFSQEMTNPGTTNITNLSIRFPRVEGMPVNVADIVDIALPRTTLGAGETMFYTATFTAGEAIDLNAQIDVLSGSAVVGQIPVNAKISISGAPQPVATTDLQISPESWTGEYVTAPGRGATQSITLVNKGTETWTTATAGPTSLPGFTFSPPSDPVGPGGSGTALLTVDPTFAGSYSDTLTISAGSSTALLFVSLTFFENVTADLDALTVQVDELEAGLDTDALNQWVDAFTEVRNSIAAAQSDSNAGRPAEAAGAAAQAEAQLALLDLVVSSEITPPDGGQDGGGDTGEGTDFTLIIVVIVLLVVAAGVVVFFKKFRGRGREEEEFDEEFGLEEGEPEGEEEDR